jgi:hypothetical protein
MEERIKDPKLEAERLRRETYLKKFGILPIRKDENKTLDVFNSKAN